MKLMQTFPSSFYGPGWTMRPVPALAAALGLSPTLRPEWFRAPSGRLMGVRSARCGNGQRVCMTPNVN